ncbi:MAG: response regulator [Rhodoferax sp.]|uniref:hybrid sensor histidine kinase/response regulator n=1 Tax=Rhodoferax sp. TaxID=50421 RepID=UPI003017C032
MTPVQAFPTSRIMVVDDTPANVELLVRMLSDRGYQTQAVLNGELALQAARSDPPDLILLDINMPHMTGYEVCEQLKADAALKDIPVIFISALQDASDKVKAFSVGGVDYVTKPFQLSEVYARVETHLSLRHLQRRLSAQNDSLELLVAQRTQELAMAYERVQELCRLKDDFMGMISHEMRTPANGILGLGDLLIDLCPPSDKRTRYASLFARSSERMVNLLDDLSLIADMDNLTPKFRVAVRFVELLRQVKDALPGVQVSITPSPAVDAFVIKGYQPLLRKALRTMVLLGAAFSRSKLEVHLSGTVDAQRLRVRIELDALALNSEQVDEFFVISSQSRSTSAAEPMGLAPVVAHRIFEAFGGELKLVKEDGNGGYLETVFLRDQSADGSLGGVA